MLCIYVCMSEIVMYGFECSMLSLCGDCLSSTRRKQREILFIRNET